MTRTHRIEVTRADFVLSWPKYRRNELEPVPQVCFAGRSNVGKSSLLNSLVNRKALARTSSTPGRTQALNIFRIDLRMSGEVRPAHFVDLPGYGYAKAPGAVRSAWGPMIEGYLREAEDLRAALILLDIRHKPTGQDEEIVEILSGHQIPFLPVATKADKVGRTQRARHLRDIAEQLGFDVPDIRCFSVPEKAGRDGLLEDIWDAVEPRPLAIEPQTESPRPEV